MDQSRLDNKCIDEAGKALLVQRHQQHSVQEQTNKIASALSELEHLNVQNLTDVDALLLQAEQLCHQQGIDSSSIHPDDLNDGMNLIQISEEERLSIKTPYFGMLSIVDMDCEMTWNQYMNSVETYADKHSVNLLENPFETMLTTSERIEISKQIHADYGMQKANCDKYDYWIAATCGVMSGLVDSFFVGMPEASKLGKWTDAKADDFVKKIAQGLWKSDTRTIGAPKRMPDSLSKCIGYLEQRFFVNYDARYAKDLNVADGVLEDMWSKNHHLKSLSHAPDLIGLIFSILDQFTGEASFVDNGKLIRVVPKENKKGFQLVGRSFTAKLFCGFCNWIGHLLSDLVGSSSTRDSLHGKTGRGSGLSIPFYEMSQFCNFGSFNVADEQLSLAELSIKVFENGYDLRFAAAMSISVVMNEIMIRTLWAVKSKYYHHRSWKASIPFGNQPELRRMLLVGHGVLCLIDGADAAIRSGGQIINFAMRLNLIAWSRFAFSGLLEIRMLFKENALDTLSMDSDLENEWKRLFSNS